MGFSWEYLYGLYNLPPIEEGKTLADALKNENPARKARRQKVYEEIERVTLEAATRNKRDS